eukprot:696011-Karenia_brevis.AAC.1
MKTSLPGAWASWCRRCSRSHPPTDGLTSCSRARKTASSRWITASSCRCSLERCKLWRLDSRPLNLRLKANAAEDAAATSRARAHRHQRRSARRGARPEA